MTNRKYQVGDHVRYTGKYTQNYTPCWIGHTGDIVSLPAGCNDATIKWDSDGSTFTALLDNIELYDRSRIHAGDDVLYTEHGSKHFGQKGKVISIGGDDEAQVRMEDNDQFWTLSTFLTKLDPAKINLQDRVAFTPGENDDDLGMAGHHGTVIALDSTAARVKWDSGKHPLWIKLGQLTKLDAKHSRRLTEDDWMEAYNLLESIGTVTLTLTKKPFKPIPVGEVYDYDIRVCSDHIQVGCQEITFDMFDRVAEAVAKAREWQAIRDQTFSNDPKVKS